MAVPTVLHVAACGGYGDDDDDTTGGADASAGGPDGSGTVDSFIGQTSSSDTSGHSHTFTVLCADLDKASVTYTATGSGHTHTITLDMTQLQSLAAGNEVTFDTSDSHPHSWSVRKPSNAC
ncbi:MAG: hypothetical protein D6689_12065 [Deltaproteobacteria bacterium]|nr:MAG: hypothetical protein D6689_12065 [Deltaproteobacteria bacterium]